MITKYHVLFTQKTKIKATRTKSNCAVKIRFINEIQRTKTFRNHVVLSYIFKLINSQLFLWLILRIVGLCGYLVTKYLDNFFIKIINVT